MHWIVLVCATIAAADPGAPVALEFRDAVTYDGRTCLQYRTIEFRQEPVQPLEGDCKPTPGAQYGQIRVGPSPETALAVVWIPKTDGDSVLWLDANGDHRLSQDERHVLSGRELSLPATITVELTPKPRKVVRTILFRRPTLGNGLRYTVRGFAVGKLPLGGMQYPAVLIDGNANGSFDSVGEDRVWIDLNQDGHFDGLTEQFPLGKPILKDKQVYVVRSDPLAAAVTANLRKPGEGKLRLVLTRPHELKKFSAELVSDLGELVAVDRLDSLVAVPQGKFLVSWLKLSMVDAKGQLWTYSFSRHDDRWFNVPLGKETAITLMDGLTMKVELDWNGTNKAKPSETVTVRPQLTAGQNSLYLSACFLGDENDRMNAAEASAEIRLLSPDGKQVSRGMSGFS